MAQPGGTPPTPEQREARFVAADANKDNKLDKAEFVSSLPERAQAMADQMWSSRVDQDGDGFVTRNSFSLSAWARRVAAAASKACKLPIQDGRRLPRRPF